MTEPPVLTTPLNRLPMSKRLRDLLAEVSKVPWEIGRIPTTDDPENPGRKISVRPTFGILYPLWTTESGPPRRPNTTWTFQATITVERADQLEVFEHKVNAAIIGRVADGSWAYPLEVAGMHIIDRRIGDQNTGGTDQQTDIRTELPTRDIRFRIMVNPWEAP